MSLRLPEQYIESFIAHEKELYNFKTKKGIDRAKLEEDMKKVSDRSVHIVKSGESLGSIANKYRISVNQLKTWNKLKNNTIYPGQKLIVYSSGATAPATQTSQAKTTQANTAQPKTTTSGGYVIYTVKSGDNLWSIAKKFDGVSSEQIKSLNNLTDKSVLKVGQQLKIKKASNSSSSGASVVHTVKSGENIWVIAKKYGVSSEQIMKLNGLNSNSVLKIGQKLIIKP